LFDCKLLSEDGIKPTRGSEGSAGWDLYASEDVLIVPGMSEVVPTSVAFAIPVGWCGIVTHRSSMAFKLDTIASLGIIDSDYRGEVRVKLFNTGTDGVKIKKGDRFAQMVITQYMPNMRMVEVLPDTDRGTCGFGSTGK